MKRNARWVVAALALTFVAGGVVNASAATADPCDKSFASPMNSFAKLKAYDACRFDRQDAALQRIEARLPSPTPAPTGSATPSVTAKPSSSPLPSPTSSSTPSTAPSATFPDATNTGAKGVLKRVGPGQLTSGPGWQYDSRGWVSAGDNAVLDHLEIPYNVDVVGDGVRITNVKITQGGESFGISIRDDAAKLLVEDSTVLAPSPGARLLVGVADICHQTCPTGTVLRRLDVSGASTGVQIQSGLLEDSYIHDLRMTDGDHVNGQTANGGTAALTIRHNTILNAFGQTDAVSLFQDFGVQQNKLVENNLLAGGGYVIYGGGGAGPTKNIKIVNNLVSTRYYPNGGFYGPVAHFAPGDPGNEWSGNQWADGPRNGQLITP